ncbi:MAG: TonB-dependent receptor [Bacteroidetes bacterium]|nr:TonB-dependent receptor [Bacteroidota bacterium]
MKLTSLLILVATLQVSARVSGQGRVSLKLNQVEISKALHSIERQGTYRFLYNSRLNAVSQKISIDVANSDIKDVLGRLFVGTDLTYKILENNLIVVLSSSLTFQDIKVTGHVTGDNGQPLSGVSVTLKGSTRGTTTDNNGMYELTVPENGTLVISYIGFTSKEVPVNSQSVVDVKLTASNTVLDQVVVVGYGVQRKLDVTGSVGQIKGADIAKQASVNPLSGIQGKVAGVQIVNTGQLGVSPSIHIRGLGTYTSKSDPLYIVDGVWVNDINFLNSADIDNISILKDASSEAIYGVRGANGVVLITTKKGKGRTSVSYNGSVGWQVANHIPKMADAHEYSILFNELTRATGGSNFLDSSQFGAGTNWFNNSLRNAIITNHQVSVNGGSEKSTYNLSLGYLDQQGILKTNKYERYTANFSNDVQISSHVKAGYNIIGTYSKSNDVPVGIWRDLYTAPPVVPVYFADGSYGDPGYYGLGQSVNNPQVALDYNHSRTQNYHLNANGYIEIRFLDHFTLRGSVGGLYEQNQNRNFTPVYKATSTQSSTHNTLSTIDYSTRNWITENTLTYSNTFGDHRVTALAGMTAYRNYYDEVHSIAQDGSISSDPNTWYLGLGNGSVGSVYDNTRSSDGIQLYPALERVFSYFGRVTYSYKDRYTITGTLRSDASTKFTTAYGRATLPSVGAAWIISNEKFMDGQHVFNSLKLKGSWGQVGNSGVPSFIATQTTFTGNAVIWNNSGVINPGQSISTAVPPALNWEKGEGTDIGLEATILKNHLDIEADVYNKNTLNFVFPLIFVGSNGYTNNQLPVNIGRLRNQGFELSLTWHDKANNDFSYSISGNISYNQNKFTRNTLGGNQKLYNGGGVSTGGQLGTITTVGEPVGEFYGYKVIGIFQTADEVTNYKDKNGDMYQPSAQPGDFKYAKTSNNGVGAIGGNDRVYLGNPNPKFFYGINTNWAYKEFDLSLDFTGVAGVDLYNANKGLRYGNENFTKDFYDKRWHGQGTSNSYPSVNIGGGQNYYANSWYVESGSYFRIRNIQLGYTMPGNYASKLGIQKVRIYVNAQNPAIFTSYKGFSPEVGGSILNGGGLPGTIGIDNDVYPISAIYNLGVNVTF